MAVSFHSLEELYNRLFPVLTVRRDELDRMGYPYIKEIDIFEVLKTNKWNTRMHLTLTDLVHDIMNITPEEINDYLERGETLWKKEEKF